MDAAKLRTPLCIAAAVCFMTYLAFRAVDIVDFVSSVSFAEDDPVWLINDILSFLLDLMGAALVIIGLILGKRVMLGAGALAIALSWYPLMGPAALIILSFASFYGSGNRVAPIVACAIWTVGWVLPLSMASTIIIPWADVAVTVAMALIIVAWPLPGKAQAAVAGRPAPAITAAPVMSAAEMEQYGKLYEAGMLTKEEFDAIRKRYLGL